MPINHKGEFIRAGRPQRRPRPKPQSSLWRQNMLLWWQRLCLWYYHLCKLITYIGITALVLLLIAVGVGVVWLWMTHQALCQFLLVVIFWVVVKG